MDFTLDPQQLAVADVVEAVLSKHGDSEDIWAHLVQAGIASLAVPEDFGGDGLGILEISTVLGELGRRAVISPAVATLGMATTAILYGADNEQQKRYFAGIGNGAVLSVAHNEPMQSMPTDPTTSLVDGRLNGTKVAVPYAEQCDRMIVSTSGGTVCIPVLSEGIQVVRTHTATGADEFTVHFTETPVAEQDVLRGVDADRLGDLVLAAAGAYGSGLLQGALRLTADYLAGRHQFGKPMTTFQMVAAQLADVYISARTVDLAAKSVVYQLSNGSDARGDLAVLGYWLAVEAPPAMQKCHHLHGGIGVDITYPMGRYYAAVKDIVRLIGGPARRLDLVGAPCLSN